MKTIAENTANFEELRRMGAVYVDKTGYFHDLISLSGRKLFFVARPRRFGKSLMISTLQAIFEGRKELFEGLEITRRDYDWQTWPVLRFNFSDIKTSSLESFQKDFSVYVEDVIRAAGLEYSSEIGPGRNFSKAIQAFSAREGKQVVILIDEYDAPIGHSFHDLKLANAIREEMSNFYIHIKSNESSIRFLMMTGVSQFAKLSVFSALNNLTDLSLDPTAAALLGYTEEELLGSFDEHLHAHAQVMGLPFEAYIEKLREWCDGYRFSGRNEVRVYNPVAVGLNLVAQDSAFLSSWSDTGRASMLAHYLQREELAELDYEKVRDVSASELKACVIDYLPPIAMLYQAGYLTIKEYEKSSRLYTLGVPNAEVREDLTQLFVFSQKGEREGSKLFRKLRSALVDVDVEACETYLKAYFAQYVYGSWEKSIHEAAYVRSLKTVLEAGGFRVSVEKQQAQGRVDMVARYPKGIFVFEVKVDDPVELALDQIREKNYTLPYVAEEVPVIAIGLTFDSATRNVKTMQAAVVRGEMDNANEVR